MSSRYSTCVMRSSKRAIWSRRNCGRNRVRWYHRHKFAMMLESVGLHEVALQCGYIDDDRANLEAEWLFIAKRWLAAC